MSEAVRGCALILAIALATAGCSRDDSSAAPVASGEGAHSASPAEPAVSQPAVSEPPALPSSLDVVLEPRTGDLDEIVKRRQIRMLVTIDRTHFFFDGAVQKGVVADAVKEFDQ